MFHFYCRLAGRATTALQWEQSAKSMRTSLNWLQGSHSLSDPNIKGPSIRTDHHWAAQRDFMGRAAEWGKWAARQQAPLVLWKHQILIKSWGLWILFGASFPCCKAAFMWKVNTTSAHAGRLIIEEWLQRFAPLVWTAHLVDQSEQSYKPPRLAGWRPEPVLTNQENHQPTKQKVYFRYVNC